MKSEDVIPTVDEMKDFVRKYEKRPGLRKLYKDFGIGPDRRHLFRVLWDEFAKRMDDAYGKKVKIASKKRQTAEDDGDSVPSAVEAVQEEQESPKNGQEETP